MQHDDTGRYATSDQTDEIRGGAKGAPGAQHGGQNAAGGPLAGVRVLDLTRVLAGPTCTQMLGDLGAEVIKIEKPGAGDDTRGFAPPTLGDTGLSAYFAGTNRNKLSVTVDIASAAGQRLIHDLLSQCDILVENFKVGALARYGLGYEQLRVAHPGLIYASITGFGQTGPYAERPGYDSLVQGMGGIMSLTGVPEGEPMKVGVPIADLFAGLYGAIGVLAALRHRDATNEGQHIDIGMLDANLAWLGNQAMNFLATGKNPQRLGNQHPNIVPYQVFATADGHIVLSIGNDPTFARFCRAFGLEALLDDDRFVTNAARVAHREVVTETLAPVLAAQPSAWWLAQLETQKIGCGPINTLSEIFADPHVAARGGVIHMETGSESVPLIANPVRLSASPVSYRRAPPLLGADTDEVLTRLLHLDAAQQAGLRDQGVI
jgi:crotonobetainyl-CoA:carnitine CoA-transferase CaiB-like acyl-CoA transferase